MVIVGGGVIGCSIAYHLAHLGWTDVVLLEQHELTAGTTWHAAGLITSAGMTDETALFFSRYSRDLYARLEAETGHSTGFNPVGHVSLATNPQRLEALRRSSAWMHGFGVAEHEITARELQDMWPLLETSDVLAGFYVPDEGRADPVGVATSMAKGAKALGARVIEGIRVTGVETKRGRVSAVLTEQGRIETEVVVNAAGMWARQLGARNDVCIPLQAAEHYYLITEPIEGVDPEWPVFEDPSRHGYYREEGSGLMIGLFEPVCAPWHVDGIPPDFSFGEIPPDWDRMGPYLERAMDRVPVTLEAGIRKFFCGPESFTPDLAPVVGEAPNLRNYFVAAGMNSVGIIHGGGLGRLMANWLVDGRPDMDITGFNIDRFQPYQLNPRYRAERTVETLGMVYQTHFPGRSMQTARGVKRSPIHDRLAEQGAYFRDVSGWEGADWYAGPGVEATVGELSWGRQSWFPKWESEHRAVREGVGLMDMSFMSKFLVQGRDAGRVLDLISANAVDGEPGFITYTQWLNEGGTLEADLTVTKLDEVEFMVVASDNAQGHVHAWLRRHIGDAHAFVTDVTSGLAQINVQGPRSRELLQSLTSVDLSNEAFPFRAARSIDIGFARALCVRITYLGELGYELFVPSDQAMHVYEQLVEAGRAVDVRHTGLKALASLRMEKGYRDYGHDIDNTDSVLEAGLGFAVALDKPGGFIGRDAVLAKKAEGPLTRRLVQVRVLDPEPLMHHAEIVLRDGTAVGYVRAASYGHTLGGAVGLAMVECGDGVTADFVTSGDWQVDIAGERHPAVASLRPMYDPDNSRIRA